MGVLAVVVNRSVCLGGAFQKNAHGVTYQVGEQKKTLVFYTDRIVKVGVSPADVKAGEKTELVVTAVPQPVDIRYAEDEKRLKMSSGALTVEIDKTSGAVRFLSAESEKCLLAEASMGKPGNGGEYSIEQSYKISADEALYGLGQFQDGFMNYRGKELLLVQANDIAIVPFLLSTNQYGLLWDNYSKSLFSEKGNRMSFRSEYGKRIDYYFVAGETADEIISGYRRLTGKAPMFAKSAYGYWQSKERYQSFDELHEVVSTFRKLNLPLDNIVQDWQYWGDNLLWSSMYFDSYNYSNPANNIQKLHDQQVKLMCSVWPSIGERSRMFAELKDKQLLFAPSHWASGKLIDLFSQDAKDIYYKHMKRGLLDNGVDAVWFDGTEPEVDNTFGREQTEKSAKGLGNCCLGDMGEYFNAYSMEATKAVYENYRKDQHKDRLFILTRSAFAGQQRNAAVTWSGDIGASWEIMRKQISAGLNFCMAGIPYWTHDIGAFFPSGHGGEYPDGIKDPAYRELYARWFQFGAFTPIFRSHGTGTPREPYLFADDTLAYSSLKKGLQLRYRLLPYIYSNAWRIYHEDYTLMRALSMDFKDKKVRNIDDTYMFGPAFLVQPVTKAMYHRKPEAGKIIPAEYLRSLNHKKGLSVEYFKGTDLKDKVFETVHPQIDFNWGGIAPERLTFHNYSMRWQGKLLALESGTYELGTVADDGIRVWIDNKPVIGLWEVRAAEYHSAPVILEKGKEYDIRVEYFQAGGDAEVRLTWFLPSELAKKQQEKMDLKQATYLPAGHKWYDFWTGKQYKGGSTVTKEYPLDIFPLFVKAGSIVPVGPNIRYAMEKTAEPVEIRIYGGADASFVYYEDDGETYDYEQGKYATIDFRWDDKRKTLTLSDRKGAFEGSGKPMTFDIVCVDEANGVGVNRTLIARRVDYIGKRTEVKF